MQRLVVLAGVLIIVLAAGGVHGQSSTYEITDVSGSIDTPERTVSLEGDSYTVSSVARVSQGSDLAVTVTAPAGERYSVYLYDSERSIADTTSQVGSGTATLATNLDAGSYVAAVYQEGTIEDIQPVVITGYDVRVDAASAATTGETVTATVQVDRTAASAAPAQVLITVWNGDARQEVTATQTSDGTYEARLDELSTGAYELYATAHGSTVVNNRQEVLGLSDSASLTVSQSTTAPPSGGGGAGGAGGTGGATDTSTPTTTPNATTASATPTTAQTEPVTQTPSETQTQTSTATPTLTHTTAGTDAPTSSSTGVITPGSATTSTTGPDPGPQIVAVLLGLLALLGLWRR